MVNKASRPDHEDDFNTYWPFITNKRLRSASEASTVCLAAFVLTIVDRRVGLSHMCILAPYTQAFLARFTISDAATQAPDNPASDLNIEIWKAVQVALTDAAGDWWRNFNTAAHDVEP